MLEGFGLNICTADSGAKAVEMARSQSFFMIFMDIHMPDMDGYTAAAKIRKFDKSVPIIALTADAITEVEEQLEQSGMNGHLSKPLQADQLNTLLQTYLSIGPVSVQESADTYFDVKALNAVFHDEKTVHRLLRQFLSTHSGDCVLLKEQIQGQNFQGAREIVHNIIGISGNLFCRKLYHAASRLGANLRLSHAESFDVFEEIWKKTLLELRMYLNDSSKTETSFTKQEKLTETLSALQQLCEDFDVNAVDFFLEHEDGFQKEIPPQTFQKLRRAVLAYDFLWLTEHRDIWHIQEV